MRFFFLHREYSGRLSRIRLFPAFRREAEFFGEGDALSEDEKIQFEFNMRSYACRIPVIRENTGNESCKVKLNSYSHNDGKNLSGICTILLTEPNTGRLLKGTLHRTVLTNPGYTAIGDPESTLTLTPCRTLKSNRPVIVEKNKKE